MKTVEKPGFLGYLILALGVAGVALMATSLATPHWIFVPGSASVSKAEAKLLAGINLTSAELTENWPTYQAAYDGLVTNQIQITIQRQALVDAKNVLVASLGGTPAPQSMDPSVTASVQADPVAAMDAQIATMDGFLAEMGQAMGGMLAINASRNAMEPMKELNQWAGFFSMCVVVLSPVNGVPAQHKETTCGGWTVFKSAYYEEICPEDYVDPNPTIPTVNSILTKTKNCNADGLAKAVKGSVGFFGGVLIAATAISLIPILLVAIMVIKPAPRGMPFNGILICFLFVLAGALALAFTVLYQFQIVGNYLDNGMVGTKTGWSWLVAVIGGAVYIVAGLPALFIRKGGEVSPA